VLISDGVYGLVDWSEYTMPSPALAGELYDGFDLANWESDGTGRHGYQHQRRYRDCVLWSGSKRLDGHTVLSGRACRDIDDEVEAGGGWPQHIAWLQARDARWSRFDFALDIVGGTFTPAALATAMLARHVVTRWREDSWRRFQSLDPSTGGDGGTVYLGAPSSDSMLRVYDKAREIREKTGEVTGPWVRVELQTRRAVARAVATAIAAGGWKAGCAILKGYLDITVDAGWLSTEWQRIVTSDPKRQLQVMKRQSTVESTTTWIASNVAPSLALLVDRADNGREYLDDLITAGRARYSAKQRSLAVKPEPWDNEQAKRKSKEGFTGTKEDGIM
jgi:DNA relaxase NicK